MLTDTGFPAYQGARNMVAESAFEYGSRRGIWRILRILAEREIRTSAWCVVMGLERNPEAAQAMVEAGHEIVSHGWRWIDYQNVPEDVEREHIRRAVEGIRNVTGERPVGWMTGRPSPNTRRLLVEEGGFLYDRDSIGDELPYWTRVGGKAHLVIPISFETNDNRYNEHLGFATAADFFTYMKDAFDTLYREGGARRAQDDDAGHPRPHHRPSRTRSGPRTLSRLRARPRPRVDRPRRRHRPALDGASSLRGGGLRACAEA